MEYSQNFYKGITTSFYYNSQYTKNNIIISNK